MPALSGLQLRSAVSGTVARKRNARHSVRPRTRATTGGTVAVPPSIRLQNALVQGDGGRFAPLPDWARFMVALGDALARERRRDGRVTVGLTVPTRAFAAVLAASGYVLRRNSK